jgi:hypothetical protein
MLSSSIARIPDLASAFPVDLRSLAFPPCSQWVAAFNRSRFVLSKHRIPVAVGRQRSPDGKSGISLVASTCHCGQKTCLMGGTPGPGGIFKNRKTTMHRESYEDPPPLAHGAAATGERTRSPQRNDQYRNGENSPSDTTAFQAVT